MAFTKITNAGFGLTTGTLVGVAASFSSTVSVGGTLTYEDVTNVDSVGLITARNGIEVTDKGVQVGTGATVDSAGDNILTFLTNGSERVRVTSDGKVGINTDMGGAPASLYPFSVYRSTGTGYVYTETAQSGASAGLRAKAGTADFTIFTTQGTGQLAVYDNTNTAERLRIDSSGNVGIKNTVAATIDAVNNAGTLVVGDGSSAEGITIYTSDSTAGELAFADATSGSGTQRGRIIYAHGDNSMRISTNGSEALRIDSSGRFLLGTSTARTNFFNSSDAAQLQIEGTDSNNSALSLTRNSNSTGYAPLHFAKSRGTSVGSNTIVQSGDYLGGVVFSGSDGSEFVNAAAIYSVVDGTPGANDMPGRLTFHTTADGASSPTERVRINAAGNVRIGSFGAPNNKNTVTPLVHVDGSGVNGGFQVNRHTSVGGGGSQLMLTATRGSSITGHTVLQSGDGVGTVEFAGSDGDEFVSAASIQVQVDTTPGGNDMPGRLIFKTTADGASSPTERLRIASDGQVYIGGSSENSNSFSDAGTFLNLKNDTYGGRIGFSNNTATAGVALMEQFAYWGNNKVAGLIAVAGTDTTNKDDGYMSFYTRTSGSAIAERMRITSEGFLGLNTSSPATDLHISGSSPHIDLGPQGSNLSKIGFASLNMYLGTTSSSGEFFFKNNIGSTDHPQSSGTLLAMITSGGELLVGKTSSGVANRGGELRDGNSDYAVTATANAHIPLIVNRNSDDGGLIRFRQANTDEGTISVSGSTITYGTFCGTHWGRLGDNSKPEILPGTIVETINKAVEWKVIEFTVDGVQKRQAYNGSAENGDNVTVEYEGVSYTGTVADEAPDSDALNKHVCVKVSDTAASKAVFGVFLGWDTDDEEGIIGTWNDMNIAALGNYFIRIKSGQTLEIGDLIESDGTGCGVVQSDDIIRSKTVAKVTSTTSHQVYTDGSFLVTCVLYSG